MSISETAENPVKSNIQGVEIHLAKINNNGQIPTMSVLEGFKQEEDPPHQPTLIRVTLTSEQ